MTYSFSYLILAAVALASVLLGAFCFWFKRRNQRLGKVDYRAHAGILLSVIFVFLLIPTMANDRVVLTETELRRVKGFWFAPESESISLVNVSRIDIKQVALHDARGRIEQHELWVATYNDGSQSQIEAGDLMKGVSSDIRRRLRLRGVQVQLQH